MFKISSDLKIDSLIQVSVRLMIHSFLTFDHWTILILTGLNVYVHFKKLLEILACIKCIFSITLELIDSNFMAFLMLDQLFECMHIKQRISLFKGD